MTYFTAPFAPRRLAALLSIVAFGAQAQQGKDALLPTATVIAAKEEVQARAAAPNPVVVVGREEIEKTNDLTLGDFLRRQPGISFTGPAGNIKDIRMRGMDKGYTQILVDGELWLGSTKERQIQVDQLPMSMIERVEIIRSPLADLPLDGIAGTINIVLRRADYSEFNIKAGGGVIDGQEGSKPQGTLQINYAHAWDNGLSLAMPLNYNYRHELKTKPKITETFSASTGARTALAEEYEVEDNRVEEYTLGPRLGFKPNDVDSYTLNGFFNGNYGKKEKPVEKWSALNPAAGTGFVSNGSSFEQEDKDRVTQRLGAQWQRRVTPQLTSQLGAMWQRASEDKYKPKQSYDSLGTLTSTELEDSTVRADSRKLYGTLRYTDLAAHNLLAGLELQKDGRQDDKQKSTNGVPASQGLGDRFDIDETRKVFYLRDDWQIAAAHVLVPGVRYELRETASLDGAGAHHEGDSQAWNPSLAYRWDMTKSWRLRAAAAQTLKPPKFEQLTSMVTSSSGSNTSSNPDKSGNPDLQPETSRGIDLGVETDFFGRTGIAAFNLSQRFIDNMVESQVSQESNGRWVERPVNIPGTSMTRAYEFDTRFDLRWLGLKDVVLLGNASRFQSRKAGTSEPLKDQPKYVYNLGMDWRVKGWQTTFGWRYNVQGKIAKASGDIESELKMLDAFVYWDINETWALRLSGSNLLDAKKDKLKESYSNGVLTSRTREQESGGRGFLLTVEARL